MIGGFLGGLANLGTVNQGMNYGVDEGSRAMLSLLALRQAQEQYQQQQQAAPAVWAQIQAAGQPLLPGMQQQPGMSQALGPAPVDASATAPLPGVPSYAGAFPQQQMPLDGAPVAAPSGFGTGLAAPQGLVNLVKRLEGGQPGSIGASGELGPMQVMPATARGMGFTPEQALYSDVPGTTYLNQRLAQGRGDPAAALVGYNRGPGAERSFLQAGGNIAAVPNLAPAYKNAVLQVQKSGQQLLSSGVPPEHVQVSTAGANQAISSFDPIAYGRLETQQMVQAIEKALPGAPDIVKLMAFEQASKLLHPQEQMQWQLYKMQNQDQLRRDLQAERERDADRRQLMAIAAGQGRADEAGWTFITRPDGSIVRGNRRTGEVVPVDPTALPPGSAPLTSGAAGGAWSSSAIDALVLRAMTTGDQSVLSQLPRGGPARKQFEEALAKKLAEDPDGIAGGVAMMVRNRMRMVEATAAAHQAGRVTMNTLSYSAEAEGAAKLVVEASKKVPRTDMPAINAIEEAGLRHTGDPNIIQLGIAINSLLNAYGKMSNPTGTGIHDADKERLNRIMSEALSQGQIEAGVQQVVLEGKNLSSALQQAQEEALSTMIPQTPGAPEKPFTQTPQAAPQQAPAAPQVGPPATQPDSRQAPTPGDVVDGWLFKGGDPHDRKNWTKAKPRTVVPGNEQDQPGYQMPRQ